MKKYIMITADIHPIGGMQLYSNGKAKYLENNGWSVYLLYFGTTTSDCLISNLNKYTNGAVTALAFRPSQLPTFIVDRTIIRILKIINYTQDDEILIESQADISALWGELIAKKLKAKHICFNCNEQFRGNGKYYEENIDFFAFKYLRGELLGLHNDTNRKVFDGYMDVPCSTDYLFDAFEPDPIQDIKNKQVDNIKRYDFNIAYLGRIIKGYVPNIINGVAEFANNNKDKTIQFIVIGDATARVDEIKNVFGKCKNVVVTYMGDLVPIPRSIYKKIDVMIAGAVCAEISARELVPTIVADCENYLSNGILGYTVNNSMYFDPKIGQTSFYNTLNDVLIEKSYLNYPYSFPEAISSDEIFKSHFCFFENSSPKKDYFDVLAAEVPKLGAIDFYKLKLKYTLLSIRNSVRKIINN